MDNEQYKDIPEEKFKFSTEQREYAEKIEGKPVGALKDAMIRFSKNKAALIAFILLTILLLFTLFGPLLVKYDYEKSSSNKYLPPKIQYIEKLGIFDGIEEKAVSVYSYEDALKYIEAIYSSNISSHENAAIEIKFKGDQVYKLISRAGSEVDGGLTLEDLKSNLEANKDVKLIFTETTNQFTDFSNEGILKSSFFEDGTRKLVYSTEELGEQVLEVSYDRYDIEYDTYVFSGLTENDYHWFGTDASGRDFFARCWMATRLSLFLGLIAAVINLLVGVIYGAISGYYGGTTDMLMQRFLELLGGVPWFVVFMLMIARFGQGMWAILFAFIITGWVGISKVTRMQFLRYRNREYVLAARSFGVKDRGLMFKHILPNGIGTLITSTILIIPMTIFGESSFAVLGLGIEGQISLGTLLNDGRVALNPTSPYFHIVFFPSIIISILMLSFNMIGNGLRDAFNPALRGT